MKRSALPFLTKQGRIAAVHAEPALFGPLGNAVVAEIIIHDRPGVGASPKDVLTDPLCGNPDTTKTVLAELGLADMAALAAKVGFAEGKPELCIALGLAAGYHQGGQTVDEAIARAKKEAPDETKKFLGSDGYIQVSQGSFLSRVTARQIGFGLLAAGLAVGVFMLTGSVS